MMLMMVDGGNGEYMVAVTTKMLTMLPMLTMEMMLMAT